MILLIRQLQTMLEQVIVFQKVDDKFKIKLAVVGVLTLVSNVPIIMSWFYHSTRSVKYLEIYLPCCFGLLVLGLTFYSGQVVLKMKKLPRIINNSSELKTERRNLFIVLFIFDLAYLLRVILECTVWSSAFSGQDNPFKYYIVTISPGVFVDVLPLAMVMWLHH